MAYTVESFKSKDDNLFSFQSGSFLCNTLHIKMTEKKKKKPTVVENTVSIANDLTPATSKKLKRQSSAWRNFLSPLFSAKITFPL